MRLFAYIVFVSVLAAGCTTVYERGNGRVVVPHTVEVRSPFGTNAGFVMIEDCEAYPPAPEEGLQPLFPEPNYGDCRPLSGWVPISSQGQGGQITQGLLIGAGTVGLGAVMPSGSNAVSSTSSVTNQVTVTGPSKHGK
jgi:hypothetical protein